MNKLSIIIPVHNEERFIKNTLLKLAAVHFPIEIEIIVVNDGSTDNTEKILEKIKSDINFKILNHQKNLGKGAAIKTGLNSVSGNLVIIQDADEEYDPIDIPNLLNKIGASIWAVYGNRGNKKWPKRGFHYVLGAKMLTKIINMLYGAHLQDTYTGYKLFNLKNTKIDLLKNLKSSGFEFEAEVTCKILKNGGKIVEIPISYTPRNKNEGKHIGAKDALKGFVTIIKNRLGLDF